MVGTIVKIAGAFCVLAAAAAFGEYKARTLASRVKQLEQFQRSLKLLVTEISYSNAVLPYAFRNVARQCHSPVNDLYFHAAEMLMEKDDLSTREIWCKAVKRVYPDSCFTDSDQEIIESLGISLGVSQKEGQLKQVRLTEEHLLFALETAREKKVQGEKMWRYLGVLSGATLVILLL